MRILVPALATCLLLPAPALAGEPGNDAANVTRELNDPARQQQIASAMEVMMQAMLEMPAAPLLRAAGVPLVPGSDGAADLQGLRAAALAVGFPVLLKASAGGGGKGMRLVSSEDELETA